MPDVVLATAVQKSVIVERNDGGTYTGLLAGYDAKFVSVVLADGTIAAVPRADVKSVRLDLGAVPKAPAASPPSASPVVTQPAPVTAAPAVASAEELVLAPHREILVKSHDKFDRITLAIGWSGLGVGAGLGLLGGVSYSPGLTYGGGFLAGSTLGLTNTTARGKAMLRNPKYTDTEVAAAYRKSGIVNLAVWSPVWFALGTVFTIAGPISAETDFAYFGYQWLGGLGYGASLGYIGAGVYDLTMAGRIGRASRTAGLVPPAVAYLSLPCEDRPGVCGGGATLAWSF